ncbi:amidophosphoribosyltransferase [Sulfolobus sp. A20]|uniref:amidophosphoribosyltransferase n=1 Tax=Saccharolobus sp. A20 TaxID=1891280 RepID=UPI000845C939|nr:amidophosphoribosyltransferase [Sulfolobus sp. A20]TRM75567.1 amidophosphoribosyltransferase [Sulfolobus sp. A20-N-F8]TRM85324.1 amidophosphoribosyltransferase [Sulfolobus sp. F3]TRM89272.1 amidophosphoribosyltransferase [Sulfolobus sp. C3]TRN02554.1 amidophosphoribosyltransferase [Sulfolobus sp. E1]AOL15838.1 amidophosphoribosyltransferase [Sulfolobus sp. A20]
MVKLHENCGIFAISSRYPINIQLVVEGLKLLQHRGQESAGISYSEREKVYTIKGLGLVEEVFRDKLEKIIRNGIGHVRYSTTGSSSIDEAQPLGDSDIVVAFNGTISNYYKFGSFKTDTEYIYSFFKKRIVKDSIIETVKNFMENSDGAYSALILMSDGKIIGMRDPLGFHPLVLGKLNDSLILSSEDSIIRQLGGKIIKHVKPGEVIILKDGRIIYDEVLANSTLSATCSFEYIYFARSDTNIDGYSVYFARYRIGEILAEKHPADGDIVIPVPDSSRPVALGFSRRSKIPLEEALVKTLSSIRSFIMPSQDKRKEVLEEKFGVVEEAVRGKKVILIDDSIVRGNTMRRIVSILRNAGATEVHIRVGSPMIKYPCYMGIDFPKRDELVAYNRTEREISKELLADSVEYLTVDELIQAIGRKDLCVACFTGNYPLKFKYDISELEKIFGK